jgi:uncharacterized protein YdcH (DUF465 family)
MREKIVFSLSFEEFNCLSKVVEHDELADMLTHAEKSCDQTWKIALTQIQAQRLRDILTEALAKVGFSKDYLPNETGIVLEQLIDKLFVP